MPGVKISNLPAGASALTTDIYPATQAGTTFKFTLSQLIDLLNIPSTLGFLPLTGGTMLGDLFLNEDATSPSQAVTFAQLQLVSLGFTVVLACDLATTGNLNAIQAGAGPGATLTNAGALAALSIDGVPVVLGNRILVKNQTLPAQNGVYTVTVVGSGAVAWVLTRAADYDQAPTEVKAGTLISINAGTTNAITSWLETATVVTVDTDPILFSQFSFGPSSFLLKAQNLFDVPSKPTALVNLGLGVPTGTGNVVLQTSPTLITPILGAATATSLAFNPTTNGIIGTTAGTPASAGFVGEVFTSNIPKAGDLPFVNNIPRDITSVVLSAGDWDVSGNVFFAANAVGVMNGAACWCSTTAATPPDFSLRATNTSVLASAGINQGLITPLLRVNAAGATTVYLSAIANISGGTARGSGTIFARRVR